MAEDWLALPTGFLLWLSGSNGYFGGCLSSLSEERFEEKKSAEDSSAVQLLSEGSSAISSQRGLAEPSTAGVGTGRGGKGREGRVLRIRESEWNG